MHDLEDLYLKLLFLLDEVNVTFPIIEIDFMQKQFLQILILLLPVKNRDTNVNANYKHIKIT